MASPPGGDDGLPQISGRQGTLDGVRAVAALVVVFYHVASTSGVIGDYWLFNGGQVGVPLFFTLSGLLLYRPWAAAVLLGHPAPRVRTYFRKRVLRILPAYWLVVVCFMVLVADDHIRDTGTWVYLLTLTHTYLPDPWWGLSLGPPHLGQIWSLSVEVAWYALLPVTAAAVGWYARRVPSQDVDARARRLLVGLAAYALVSVAYTVAMFVPEPRPLLGLWVPRFFVWFAIGMALAVVTVWARSPGAAPVAGVCRAVADAWGACWLGAALLYVIAATPVTGPIDLGTPDTLWTSLFDLVLYGLCAVAFVAPVALAPPGHAAIGAALGNPVMRFLGRVSYGLFLWQMLIIVGWYEWRDRVFHGGLLPDLPLLLAATIAAATATHYLVERPVQWAARTWERRAARRRADDRATASRRAEDGRFAAAADPDPRDRPPGRAAPPS
ncbi:acyltransferase family protein [Actinomadura rubrobrunea]|uniref:acyltransferase family protein n=1 Tax=Actinomadura rubrobrunea TaxID=115335 RepID=UPI0009FC1239|nr:acyltransferase [Actinomadura rubrobrunea]